MTILDYEPRVARRGRGSLPGFIIASVVTSALAIALLAIGLWDDQRGGNFMSWVGLWPIAMGMGAVALGAAGIITGPLRIIAVLASTFGVLVTWVVGKILAGYWGG